MAGLNRGIILVACCLTVFWPGAFIFEFPVFTQLLIRLGYGSMTLICGLTALIVGLLGCRLVRFPRRPTILESEPKREEGEQPLSLELSQSLRTRAFWLLWLTYATAGVAMVALSTAFGLSKGLSIQTAVLFLLLSI